MLDKGVNTLLGEELVADLANLLDSVEVLEHGSLLDEEHRLQLAILTDHVLALSEAEQLQKVDALNLSADELRDLLVLQFELVILCV